ncbi:MAG: hypothetical protein NVSMB26_24860 [Beijerinckiaceae bacterium]
MLINLVYDSQAQAAPQSFRDEIQAAANILDVTFKDNITVNIEIGYGEYPGNGSPETNGSASSAPSTGVFDDYSQVRTWLAQNAAAGVQSGVAALPTGSSIQGQTQVAVWRAEEKLMGQVSTTDTGLDGYSGFATDISLSELEGVALHELTHAMGRVTYGPQPDIMDLFRFSGPGTWLFTDTLPASASYFSLDGGTADLADYGRTSDDSDFLNSSGRTPNDPFNEFYNASTIQGLTRTDLLQMESLGFHAGVNAQAAHDFNGDGKSDILWSDTAGDVVQWLMNGQSVLSSSFLGGSPWTVVGTGDFNGNGRWDLLWQNSSTGNVVEWDMNGSTVLSSGLIGGNNDWVIAGTGDFNGDGKSDLLWRQNSTGALVEWDMNDRSVVSQGLIEESRNLTVVGTGDFNGDGKTDLLLRDSTTGAVSEWVMNGLTVESTAAIGGDLDWSIAGTGDFNGDGKTDLLWQQRSTGALVEWDMNGSTATSSGVLETNTSWSVAGTGDFNGDGFSDILMRDNTNGGVVEWQMNDRNILSSTYLGGGSGWNVLKV